MSATSNLDRYNLLYAWLTLYGIVKINTEKLKRQVVNIARWQDNGCNGSIEAVTGYGKTWVGLFAIYLLQRAFPDYKFIIVVPSTKLFDDWNEHITNFNLKNCRVCIVNTYTREQYWNAHWECDVLIADEGHRYLGTDSKFFSKVLQITKRKATLLLSATLDAKEKDTLTKLGIPVVDTVSMQEAKKMGFVSDYLTFNYAIELSEEEKEAYEILHKRHNDLYARFQHFPDEILNYELARACNTGKDKKTGREKRARVGGEYKTGREWRLWYAQQQQWDGTEEHDWSPSKISGYSFMWSKAVADRKDFLYKHPAKIREAVKVIEALKMRTITFAESTDTSMALVEQLGDKARAYHSKIPSIPITAEQSKIFPTKRRANTFATKNNGVVVPGEEEGTYVVIYQKTKKLGGKNLRKFILKEFEEDKFDVLCTAKALDEGFNVEGIQLAIIISATSKLRQYIQRQGRAIRYVAGKIAIIMNFYIPGTKDEKWLQRRQKGETNIKYINSIEQLLNCI